MARQLRVQFPGAIYHVVTRGDGRRQIYHDGGHYDRFTHGLKEEVTRSGWKVLSFCWMPNHIHLLVQTPEPNLARGRNVHFQSQPDLAASPLSPSFSRFRIW